MKKTCAFLLAVMMIIPLLSSEMIAGALELEYGFGYNIYNGEAHIAKYTGNGGKVTIPSTLGGYPVTKVNMTGFGIITNLIIPDCVETIYLPQGQSLSALQSITFGNGISTIEYGLFQGCSKLKNVTFGNGLRIIEEKAFYNCDAIISIQIPEGVISIGVRAFMGCNNLNTVFIPASVQDIGNFAFSNCNNVTAFNVDINNSRYCQINGCLVEKDQKAILAARKGATIPSDGSVESIDFGAFSGHTMTSITIPETITYIGNSAFEGCSELTTMTIPDSVMI